MAIRIDEAMQHLSEIVQIKSLSTDTFETTDFKPFLQIHEWLKKTYPNIHQVAQVEVVNTGSLLYRIPAKNPVKEPLLFMAHMDVVPVDEGTKDKWLYDGFSGMIKDDTIYGRGTKDMKNQLTAFFEAVEYALKEGKTWDYDLYFCLGHDEENGGKQGVKKIVELCQSRHLHFGMILDEGGVITDNVLGLKDEVALVGVCEKGFANIRISYEADGGHSSMPPKSSALGKVCKAAYLLEKNQMPVRITLPLKQMLTILSPLVGGAKGFLLGHHQLFGSVLKKALTASDDSNALARTTTAVTMAEGASATNVLPNKASIVVNFRLLSGDTVEDLMKHVRSVIGDDYKIELLLTSEASKVSKIDERFALVEKCIKEAYPKTKAVVPFIMVGGTDSKHFDPICDHIYKFGPFRCNPEARKTIHGINEFLHEEDLQIGINYFYNIVLNY